VSYDQFPSNVIIHIGKYKGKKIRNLTINQLRDCLKSKIPSRLKSIINMEIAFRIKSGYV
jgi:hypothetical protein